MELPLKQIVDGLNCLRPSILHHLVFLPDPYESMRFLIDRGIDMTIKDYRWNSTAQGWARYGNNVHPPGNVGGHRKGRCQS